jgi:hypothetical protein
MTEITKIGTDLEEVEIARKEKPDVRFKGRLLAEVDSRTDADRGGRTNSGRWTSLQLWELESGTWVAAAIGCSDKDGEIDIGDIERIPTHHIVEVANGRDIGDERAPLEPKSREQRAMDFWGWSWLAKKLADKLGWDVVEDIE